MGRRKKVGRPKNGLVVRNKHRALMDLMISKPWLNQNELAKIVGYEPNWVSSILRSARFIEKFEERRNQHEESLSLRVVAVRTKQLDATCDALDISREIMGNKGVEIPIRQESIRNILDLGHAKAVERSASLNANIQIPPEIIKSLGVLAEEISQPFVPKRLLKRKDEPTDQDIRDVEQSI